MSIIFATLVTRPNVTQGIFTKEEIELKRANLLFFGNFHEMSLTDYKVGVDAMMNDPEFLYGSMTQDIYFLGKVLARKYLTVLPSEKALIQEIEKARRELESN